MSRYKFLAFSNSVEGRDEEFNAWYDAIHAPDICSIPGFVSCERFTAAGGNIPYRYMAIYEVETDDIAATMLAFREAISAGTMVISDCLDRPSAQTGFWAPYKA